MNLVESYLAALAGLDFVTPGMDIRCRASCVAAHDVTAPIAIRMFREIGVNRVFDRDRIIMIVDHIYPAATENARDSAWVMADFAREFCVHIYQRGEGVTHQLLYERHRAKPGELVVVADSHTGTCGGYGAIGIGVGSTEFAATMATGYLDLEVPEVVQICLSGAPPSNTSGKDLILWLGGLFGSDYLTDRALIFTGPGIAVYPVEERMTICNMATELGSMITLFGTEAREPDVWETHELDLSALVPQIACPYSPANAVPVTEVAGTPITQVVVGSCTNGRLNDVEQVVRILAGRQVHPDVNMLLVPASVPVLDGMEERGWCRLLREAGVTILNPGCGSCFGAHEGVVSERDVVVSTTNRNFPGRMGNKKARIYLASPATAAASALAGVIAAP